MTIKKPVPAKVKIKTPAKLAARLLAKPVVKAVPELAEKKKKEQKLKVVRDSFTMPQKEYQKINDIKLICLKAKLHVKKSEVLRAGLHLLAGLSAMELKRVMGGLEKIKTGRPKKH